VKNIIIITSLILLVAGLGILFWPKNNEPQKPLANNQIETIEIIKGLNTCPVCGYDAVSEKGSTCANCSFAINKQEADAEYLEDLNSLIIDRQISYFMPDTLGKTIDFLTPKISKDGYPKNPNWRPLVFESQIYEYQKIMMEVDALLNEAENIETEAQE